MRVFVSSHMHMFLIYLLYSILLGIEAKLTWFVLTWRELMEEKVLLGLYYFIGFL